MASGSGEHKYAFSVADTVRFNSTVRPVPCKAHVKPLQLLISDSCRDPDLPTLAEIATPPVEKALIFSFLLDPVCFVLMPALKDASRVSFVYDQLFDRWAVWLNWTSSRLVQVRDTICQAHAELGPMTLCKTASGQVDLDCWCRGSCSRSSFLIRAAPLNPLHLCPPNRGLLFCRADNQLKQDAKAREACLEACQSLCKGNVTIEKSQKGRMHAKGIFLLSSTQLLMILPSANLRQRELQMSRQIMYFETFAHKVRSLIEHVKGCVPASALSCA